MVVMDRRAFIAGAAASVICGTGALAEEAVTRGMSSSERRKVRAAVDNLMNTYSLQGVSLALARDGQLSYVASFGYANVALGYALTTGHRMRIGSISKTITASAIMLLRDRGQVTLEDRVFGPDGWLEDQCPTSALPDRNYLREITVDHLLTHSVGGWANGSNDPVFRVTAGQTRANIIRQGLVNFPLTQSPGLLHDYSNFGYLLLGRIIEAATGQGYEDYVRSNILVPAGAGGMRVAQAGDQPYDDETRYYAVAGDPYGGWLSPLDSVGAWTTTPTDLIAFIAAIDGFKTVPDLLKRSTVNVMTTPTRISNGRRARGWLVNTEYNNWWHDGSYPGTRAIAIRYNFGVNAVLITNNRSDRPDELNRSMQNVLLEAARMT